MKTNSLIGKRIEINMPDYPSYHEEQGIVIREEDFGICIKFDYSQRGCVWFNPDDKHIIWQ